MIERPGIFLNALFESLEIPEKSRRTFLIHVGVFFALVVGILYFDPSGFNPEVTEGSLCRKAIVSPKNISFVDERKTEEIRRLEEEKVEPIVTHIENSEQEVMAKLDRFLDRAGQLYNDWKDKELTEWTDTVVASYFSQDRLLEPDSLKELVSLSRTDFDRVKTNSRKILQNFAQRTITARNLDTMKASVAKEVRLPNEWTTKLVVEIVRNSLVTNAIEDEKLTRQKRELARESVTPVKRSFTKGQKIIDQGVIITADDIYVLRAIEKQIQKNRLLGFVGNLLLSGLLIGALLAHLRLTRHSLLKDLGLFRLQGGLLLVTLFLCRFVYSLGSAIDQPGLAILLSPLPSTGLLTAVLIDGQLALFQQMLLGILLFVISESNARFAIVSLIGSITGVLFWLGSSRTANLRGNLGWTGLKIGAVNAIAMNALMMLDVESSSIINVQEMLTAAAFGIGNGIFTGILVNGTLPYLENAFALASGSRLLELTDLSQPLLRRMAEEAPGTYQHSIAVATLSEAAAAEINADALLAKIGGYFHDIGKLKRPMYFAENQKKGENQHDHLTPYMSSLILVGHIRDGIDLGREYGLPESVINFISQHHGTSLISYFYDQAKNSTTDGRVSQDRFRYGGPKPQTKETAIVMLADAVEASARTLPQHTHNRVEALVKKIVRGKMEDDQQLDQSELTLKDIETIEQTFVKVILSMYHGRIEYPGKYANQPGEKGETDGGSHQQPPKEG